MTRLEVEQPGVFSCVQDAGRFGYAYFAVPASGPMDPRVARAGNRLVGNRTGAPVIEFNLRPARLRFLDSAVIALVGADMQWALDGNAAPINEPLEVVSGSVLDGAYGRHGQRGYLAVAGELVALPELGSVSMHTHVHGRLEAGRILQFGPPVVQVDAEGPTVLFPSATPARLRFQDGPEWDALTPDSKVLLRQSEWSISPRSDRVGLRLDGPRLELRPDWRFESVPTWPGVMQVNPAGEVIVVAVDGGVVGGYPRVAYLPAR